MEDQKMDSEVGRSLSSRQSNTSSRIISSLRRGSVMLVPSLDKKVWYERLNLVNKLKRFCQACAGNMYFWSLVAILSLSEPVLCSFYPRGLVFQLQILLLLVSTILYFIQLIGVATREWDKIVMIKALTSLSSFSVEHNEMMNFNVLKLLIFFTAEGEYILEFACLFIGWMAIFFNPGIAVLRCFRVFRLLWFYEVEVFRTTVEWYFNPLLGEQFVSRAFKVLKFAIKGLSALGNEMFRLTAATRGGLLLMIVFFYSAFVLGAALWVETAGGSELCQSLGECSFTLMRLTFFDGDGFDFAFFLTGKHPIMFLVVMMYLCLTSFGIMNGLVGIFGTAFAQASDVAFNDDETDDTTLSLEEEPSMLSKNEVKGNEDPTGNEEYNESEDENGETVYEYRDSTKSKLNPSKESPRESEMSVEEQEEVRKKLASMFGKSNFAMKELSNGTKPEAVQKKKSLTNVVKKTMHIKTAFDSGKHGSTGNLNVEEIDSSENNNSPKRSPMKKISFEDVVNMKKQRSFRAFAKHASKKYTVVPSEDRLHNELRATPVREEKTKSHHGMFGIKPIKGSSKNMMGSSAYGINTNFHVAASSAAEMKIMAHNIKSMQSKLESQNELITAMYSQILQLNQMIHHLHPEFGPLKIQAHTNNSTDHAGFSPPNSRQISPRGHGAATEHPKGHAAAHRYFHPNHKDNSNPKSNESHSDAESTSSVSPSRIKGAKAAFSNFWHRPKDTSSSEQGGSPGKDDNHHHHHHERDGNFSDASGLDVDVSEEGNKNYIPGTPSSVHPSQDDSTAGKAGGHKPTQTGHAQRGTLFPDEKEELEPDLSLEPALDLPYSLSPRERVNHLNAVAEVAVEEEEGADDDEDDDDENGVNNMARIQPINNDKNS